MTTDQVRVWHEWSDWVTAAAVPESIECIAAALPAADGATQADRAEELGRSLALGVETELESPQMWLLVAALDNFGLNSRSGSLRARRRGLVELEQAEELGFDLGARIEFEVSEDGQWGRLVAALPLEPGQWGSAIRLMLDVAAVGVALREGGDPREIMPRLGSVAMAGEGASPLHARAFHLRKLFADDACVGVLTATGVFDDPELIAEYHYRNSAVRGAS